MANGAVEEHDLGEDLGGGKYAADCQARVAFEVLANRWDSVIVYILGESGPMRPRALITRIGGISPKVLNEALRRLEYNGLVVRQAYAEAPPRVDYALTQAGIALLGPIRAMGAWAGRYAEAVLAAQTRLGPREDHRTGPNPRHRTAAATAAPNEPDQLALRRS